MNNALIYAACMLIAGIGIPTMAMLNGGLGGKLMSSTLATAISLAVGFTAAVIYLLATEGMPTQLFQSDTPFYFYLGGFCVAFYIISVTWIAPRFGISNAIAFALLGQLISMSAIDHFGLLGAQQYGLTTQRMIGLAFMAAGVFMVLDKVKPAAIQ